MDVLAIGGHISEAYLKTKETTDHLLKEPARSDVVVPGFQILRERSVHGVSPRVLLPFFFFFKNYLFNF